ncbi:MAG TPA: hypothetical protein DCG69_02000 [Bacteroidales bacterium]|nr:hypothetical protein [Bacteroidales bacterium]
MNLLWEMLLPKTKLKNQFALISALSKVLLIVLSIFVIPWLVRIVSIRETDDQLIEKLDQIYNLIEIKGIENFIDEEDNNQGFGSYNILKEEYISIEKTADSLLVEFIDYQQREIDGEIYEYRVISATFSINDQVYLLEIGKSIDTIVSLENKLQRFAFYFLLILLGISTFIDLSIVQILLKPFGKIIERLKNSNHPKQFDYNIIPSQTSDFIYLQNSISDLMHQIESAFETEREFIGNASHELLTPISIIRTKLDNFAAIHQLNEAQTQKLFEVKTTLSRLTKMVRSLLLLSRIENREYLKNESIDLIKLITAVKIEFEDRADLKQQSIQFIHPNENFTITGNTELLQILFGNLLSNAIKYTPEKGAISISIEKNLSQFLIQIQDNGPGIDPTDLPRIFDRFKRFGVHKESFGIGLALVKQIADYHDFKIKINSKPQEGTAFLLLVSNQQ